MKHKTSYLFISTLVIVTLLGTSAVWAQTNNVAVAATAQKITAPATVKAAKASTTSLKLSWSKVPGAKGYAVYQCKPKAKIFKKVKTLAGSKVSWINTKLAKNKVYKYKVRAFMTVNGTKKYSPYSYVVSAKTFTKAAKTVNVKSVKADYTNRYLGLMQVAKVKASVSVPKGKKAISKNLRWTSSNPSIVTVNGAGWLQAKGKTGSAKVYIRAHNGVTKTLNVTVKDYANPAVFSNLQQVRSINNYAADDLILYKESMCKIVACLEKYKSSAIFFYEDGGTQFIGTGVNYDSVVPELEQLLKDAGMFIYLDEGKVAFLNSEHGYIISYSDFNGKDNAKNKFIKIAPCWYFDGSSDA